MATPKSQAIRHALLGTLAAAVSLALGHGFTVDDALISTRVAHHLSSGAGYRFNLDDSVVDAVTPLGWAYLIAPFSTEGAWAGLQAARVLGALCALATGTLLGLLLSRLGGLKALWALVPLALSLPFGAWSQSGMETPVVTLLVCVSLCNRRGTWLAASAAAAWRPELLPWALVWAALKPAERPAERVLSVLQTLSLPLLVALVRFQLFGQIAPLSVFAKPADATLGFVYVLSGLVFIGFPLASLRLPKEPRRTNRAGALSVALWANLLGLGLAGGDWMALYRLFVPLLPVWALLFGERLVLASKRKLAGRVSAAVLLCSLLLFTHGSSSRGVVAHRERAIKELAPQLLTAKRVGTLDVGWVGAATSAWVVDFAGVTDIEVALLAGSHTSKRIPADFIRRKRIDHLVLLLDPSVKEEQIQKQAWTTLKFARVVEQRVSRLEEASQFYVQKVIEFGGEHRYLVLSRHPDPL